MWKTDKSKSLRWYFQIKSKTLGIPIWFLKSKSSSTMLYNMYSACRLNTGETWRSSHPAPQKKVLFFTQNGACWGWTISLSSDRPQRVGTVGAAAGRISKRSGGRFRKDSERKRRRCDAYPIIVVAGNLLLDGSGHGIVDFGCPTPPRARVDDGRQHLGFHAQPASRHGPVSVEQYRCVQIDKITQSITRIVLLLFNNFCNAMIMI